MEANTHWELCEIIPSLGGKCALSWKKQKKHKAWIKWVVRGNINAWSARVRKKGKDMFLRQNTTQARDSIAYYLMQHSTMSFFPHTFTLVVREDGLVFLHDVGVEQSFSNLTIWVNATAQVGPEGGFEREVPWSWDSIFSWWVKKRSTDFLIMHDARFRNKFTEGFINCGNGRMLIKTL